MGLWLWVAVVVFFGGFEGVFFREPPTKELKDWNRNKFVICFQFSPFSKGGYFGFLKL